MLFTFPPEGAKEHDLNVEEKKDSQDHAKLMAEIN